MSPVRKTLLTGLVLVTGALAVYYRMQAWLDSSDLLPRLLSPTRDGFFTTALLGVSFFVLRLTLLFVVPGAVLTRVVVALLEQRSSRPADLSIAEDRAPPAP